MNINYERIERLLRQHRAKRTAEEYLAIIRKLEAGDYTDDNIPSRARYLQIKAAIRFMQRARILPANETFGLNLEYLDYAFTTRNHRARQEHAVKEKVITDTELARLLAALPDTPKGAELKLACLISRRSGARLSEVLALMPEQLRYDAAAELITWTIPNGKGGKPRQTWMPGELWPELQALGHFSITYTYVVNTFPRAAKKAGVNTTFHGLRHTMATQAVRNGMNVVDLAAVLGHSNLNTTMKYVQAARECPPAMKQIW